MLRRSVECNSRTYVQPPPLQLLNGQMKKRRMIVTRSNRESRSSSPLTMSHRLAPEAQRIPLRSRSLGDKILAIQSNQIYVHPSPHRANPTSPPPRHHMSRTHVAGRHIRLRNPRANPNSNPSSNPSSKPNLEPIIKTINKSPDKRALRAQGVTSRPRRDITYSLSVTEV